MNLPDDFVFSQTSLQDYLDCPRRFELKYLLRQRWPAPDVDDMLDFEQRMARGERFHHLVHQHLVGIPAESLRATIDDEDVRRWFEAYLATGLEGVPDERRPELMLTAPLGDYGLLAKFDLLALEPGGRALIVDWKTGSHPPRADRLAQRMQTVVYRWVLAEAGDALYGGQPIPPDKIEMVYWYGDGETRRFPYDAAQHAAESERLGALIKEIDTRPDFPLTTEQPRCRFCPYRSLCDRGEAAGPLDAWEAEADGADDLTTFRLDLDQIGEIAF